MTHRPNILILMSDEHRADLMGCAGNPVIQTPTLDMLARTGVMFTNCYAPSPICVPARQCLMSGQLPKTCGCDGSWMDLPAGYHTFARRFSQYAYRTVCSGKLHHIGYDQMQGWSKRLAPDAEIYDKYNDGLIRNELMRYPSASKLHKQTDEDIVKDAKPENGKYQAFDEDATQAMVRYIRTTVKSGDRPYLLKVSLLEPHYPYRTDPERYRRYYDAAPIYQESSCDHPVLSVSQDDQRVVVSEEEIRRATATYYGMVDAIDSRYADILNALTDSGQTIDDWIIVYLSDHGEMLGQHGLWEKARFYEASVRAPLIIRWPKRFKGGTVVHQNVSLCDLFATLCDLAGLPVQPGLDSRTLVPLMDGRIDGWSDEVVSQIRRNRRDHVMIKRGSLKYQHYGVDIPDVLFDLDADPGELRNVIADPKYADAVAAFRTRLGELGYGQNADTDYTNAGYASGLPEAAASSGTLWRADANPWQESF